MLSQKGSDLWDIFIISHHYPESTHSDKKISDEKSDIQIGKNKSVKDHIRMMLMRILTSIRMSQRWDNFIVLRNGAKSTHQNPSQSPSESTHNDCIKKIRLKCRITEKIFWLWTISNRNRNMFCVHLQKRKNEMNVYVKRIVNVTQHFTESVYCLLTVAVSKNIKNWHRSHDETHSSLWSCSSSQRRNIILLSHSFWHN